MSKTNWTRSDNFIIPIVNRTHISAKDIFNKMDENLAAGIADTKINELYIVFHPFNVTYNAGFAAWNALKSSNPGKTLDVQQIVEELIITCGNWDVAIQGVHNRTSGAYKSLFPKHRSPFQSGTVASRIIAIEALIAGIGTDALLSTLKAEIVTFLADFKAARTKQSGQITTIDTALTTLDEATLAAAERMFYVYGGLVMRFFQTPKSMEDFMPVSLLQESFQTTFVATTKNNKPRRINKRKLDPAETKTQLTSVGPDIIHAYYTTGLVKIPGVGDPFVVIEPNSTNIFNPTDLGYTDAKRCLFVMNMGTGKTMITIKFI